MGTHPSKVQGKREHNKTQPKAKNQPKSGKDLLMAMKLQSTITKKT
jgi:hypothetical protein